MKRIYALFVVSLLATVGFISGMTVYAQSSTEDAVEDDFQPNKMQHVVEDGDTLWDICDAVLGRPELWPRVWSMNPEITNPHWIYPGDIIRLSPRGGATKVAAMAAELTGVDESEEDETETLVEEEEVLAYDDFLNEKSPPIEVIAAATQRKVPPEEPAPTCFLEYISDQKAAGRAG